jgi:hypothetical protein
MLVVPIVYGFIWILILIILLICLGVFLIYSFKRCLVLRRISVVRALCLVHLWRVTLLLVRVILLPWVMLFFLAVVLFLRRIPLVCIFNTFCSFVAVILLVLRILINFLLGIWIIWRRHSRMAVSVVLRRVLGMIMRLRVRNVRFMGIRSSHSLVHWIMVGNFRVVHLRRLTVMVVRRRLGCLLIRAWVHLISFLDLREFIFYC